MAAVGAPMMVSAREGGGGAAHCWVVDVVDVVDVVEETV